MTKRKVLNNDTEEAPIASREVRLTKQQKKVLALRFGNSPEEIAQKLFIDVRTVNFHLVNAYRALGVHNSIKAYRRAQRLGFIA